MNIRCAGRAHGYLKASWETRSDWYGNLRGEAGCSRNLRKGGRIFLDSGT